MVMICLPVEVYSTRNHTQNIIGMSINDENRFNLADVGCRATLRWNGCFV